MAECSVTCVKEDPLTEQSSHLSLSKLNELANKSPNEVLNFIRDNRFQFLSLFKEKDTKGDFMSFAIIALGTACTSEGDLRKYLNDFMITMSSNMDCIVINIQRCLVSFYKQEILEKYHLDALFHLTVFLKTFQIILPSSSFDSISILLPLLISTCNKCLKNHVELHSTVSENLNEIQAEQKLFVEHHTTFDIKRESEREKLHLLEPPENFRSLSILPTVDDIDLPCLFLRPNISKGKYKDTEHYLDVQFRLLREDYIKPLRDGIAEYLSIKRKKQSLKNCKNVRVYNNVFIASEKCVDGELLHVLKFREDNFSEIKWENSKRFLTGNLLCLSTDDFRSILFATVIRKDPKELKDGLLTIKFEEKNDEVLTLTQSINFVVIETSALFESYRHNLKVLQLLKEESLPMKKYIVDVEKTVNRPQYLKPTTTFDFRPLLLPLNCANIFSVRSEYLEQRCPKINLPLECASLFSFGHKRSLETKHVIDVCKSVTVTDDSRWPTASMLNLDESQYLALKSAITKEFSIIQGPPGTGKTFIGLRTVQLLLHNINSWYDDDLNSLPILIVCYTNHALDQFLEGILMFTKKIVRIGGRVSNDTIEEYGIKKLVKSIPNPAKYKFFEAKDKICKLKEQINLINEYIEYSTKRVLNEYILKDYIPPAQYQYLRKCYSYRQDREKYNIYDWLMIETLPTKKFSHNKNLNYTSVKPNEEVESEGEADIEFIENQRNVDFYDFEDIHVFKRRSLFFEEDFTESNDQKWEYQRKNNKEIAESIRKKLLHNTAMKIHRATRIKNVWMLPIHERWQLYKFWLEKFIEGKRIKYKKLQEQLKIAFKDQADARTEEDLYVIESAHVVGMTTTGAAKYRHIIDAKNPIVLIVEEAAEILESHIITSLASKTQHVVLIGDQQQLRPSPTVYMLAVKYGMNISLFERMIKNGMDYCTLSIQHRMRPEIAALIVPHIYTHLENHKVVTEYENIKGVSKNVFFVTHNFDELLVQDSKSKVNEHEAKFIIKLCRYLLLQGYEPSKITVLTTYSGQLFALKKLATETDDVKEIRFTVVDNFQGEENDIILISFVRSNIDGEVGFLKVSNRICVALSRAKKGLYCIGNFELLAQKSKLWKNILKTLSDNKSVGPSLCLTCQNHTDVFNEVTNDTDFASVPDGGCIRKCEFRLQCGHSCVLSCHPYDRSHKVIECKKPCSKNCKEGHQCRKKCFEDCGTCEVLVDKVLARCGHTANAPCGVNETNIECQYPCSKTCKEGHPCFKKCYQSCGDCETFVDKTFTECGHTAKVLCCESKTAKCEILIEKTLSTCGHTVEAECGERENQIRCTSQCKKILRCLHQCINRCYEPCVKTCLQLTEILSPVCGHTVKVECCFTKNLDKLARRCKGTCSGCKERCEHLKCKETCQKILLCGHSCINKCSEPCITECMQLTQIQSTCGHFLEIECHFASRVDKLSQKCSEPCGDILPCGHTCKGTCSSCHQGRLHVSCKQNCERILICGHKCESKCFMSCLPCGKPCENGCIHRKCPRKCGSPCVKCFKPCEWNCSHKKCNFRCNEICDREPCNEPCLRMLSCKHPCIGFCGEPCPKECLICDDKWPQEKPIDSECDDITRYVYLEDCKHIFKERDLSKWMTTSSEEMQEIRMKTCPICKTVIRKNVRFGKIIKHCLAQIEKVKQITKWNKEENFKIQSDLLEQAIMSHPNISTLYKPIIKTLSSGYVRNIHELTNITSILDTAKKIEGTYRTYAMFVQSPFLKTLVHYIRSCREWLRIFIRENFLTVSEFQLLQLLKEAHRLSLLDFLLKFSDQKHVESLSSEFQKCASYLVTFKPFNNDSIISFESSFKSLIESFSSDCEDVPEYNSALKVVSVSGNWYQCPKEHIICIADCDKSDQKVCYKCDKITGRQKIMTHPVTTDIGFSNDIPCHSDTAESSRSNIKHFTSKDGRFDDEDFVQKVYSKTDNDRTLPTHSAAASVKPKYASRFSREPAIYGRSIQPKELRPKDMKNISGSKSYGQTLQWYSSRNKNEVNFSNRLSNETIITSASVSHQGQDTRGRPTKTSRPRQPIGPSKGAKYNEGFKKNKDETI